MKLVITVFSYKLRETVMVVLLYIIIFIIFLFLYIKSGLIKMKNFIRYIWLFLYKIKHSNL